MKASIRGPAAPPARRSLGLGAQILLGMGVGAVLGVILGERISIVEPVGTLFIRLLMIDRKSVV